MKIIELRDKILQPISNEEHELLCKFDNEPIAKSSLNEREQELANQLTVKNILLRVNNEQKIYYSRKI